MIKVYLKMFLQHEYGKAERTRVSTVSLSSWRGWPLQSGKHVQWKLAIVAFEAGTDQAVKTVEARWLSR